VHAGGKIEGSLGLVYYAHEVFVQMPGRGMASSNPSLPSDVAAMDSMPASKTAPDASSFAAVVVVLATQDLAGAWQR